MIVDDRYNYFMMGATAMLYSGTSRGWWFILFILMLAITLSISLKMLNVLGSADLKTIFWSFIGFSLIAMSKLVAYLLILAVIISLYHALKAVLSKLTNTQISHLPFYPVLLITFILAAFI